MTTKTTSNPDTDDREPFDLLKVLERPSDHETTPATLGDITVHVKTSWTGAEAARVSTTLAGGLEDVIRAIVPDTAEADAAWEFVGGLLAQVASKVVMEMLKLAGLATDQGFLAPSPESVTPEGGAAR
ncbi:MAG: hypothetical protein L0K27_01665 [Corynebacterium nuruki]|jgi:hypothetical protein|nr:hypothetical protein [Corynebacterium nuruki]